MNPQPPELTNPGPTHEAASYQRPGGGTLIVMMIGKVPALSSNQAGTSHALEKVGWWCKTQSLESWLTTPTAWLYTGFFPTPSSDSLAKCTLWATRTVRSDIND